MYTYQYSLLLVFYAASKGTYSKAPKSVTAFNLFTFFRADLIQSDVNCKLSTAFDWIKSARKNVNKLKVVTLLGALL